MYWYGNQVCCRREHVVVFHFLEIRKCTCTARSCLGLCKSHCSGICDNRRSKQIRFFEQEFHSPLVLREDKIEVLIAWIEASRLRPPRDYIIDDFWTQLRLFQTDWQLEKEVLAYEQHNHWCTILWYCFPKYSLWHLIRWSKWSYKTHS